MAIHSQQSAKITLSALIIAAALLGVPIIAAIANWPSAAMTTLAQNAAQMITWNATT